MFTIPILDRMLWSDYKRLLWAVIILLTEKAFRMLLFFVPYFLRPKSGKVEDPLIELHDAADIIKAHGYGVEEHVVVTPDGYLLVLHRILPRTTQNGMHVRKCQTPDAVPMTPSSSASSNHNNTNGYLSNNRNHSQTGNYDPRSAAMKMLYRQNSIDLNTATEIPQRLLAEDTISEEPHPDEHHRPPVLAMHGLMMSSESWVVFRNPRRNIMLNLCDAG